MKNNQLKLAVAGAVLGMASAANAGIIIPAGEWTVDLSGNINTFYSNTNYSGALESSVLTAATPAGTAQTTTYLNSSIAVFTSTSPAAAATNASLGARTAGNPLTKSANQVSTGLLPSAIGIGAKSRQNDLDIAIQTTFFVGANASSAGTGAFNSGNGLNSINVRQAFLSFGDKSWGTIKMGRDLGVFGSDAILSDMTLLGVGTGAGGAGNSTLGRIGSGYLYADWNAQIQYQSPNFNGFQVTGAIKEPVLNSANHNLGYDGKATFDFAANGVDGRIWVGGIYQKLSTAATAASTSVVTSYTYGSASGTTVNSITTTTRTTAATNAYTKDARAVEVGAKINFAGLGLVGYYYDGQNIGSSAVASTTPLSGLFISNSGSADQDVKGGYVQATYVLPTATKIGASWGQSKIDRNSDTDTANTAANSVNYENRSWVIGAYHPLTKHLNLVAEYTDTKYEGISNFRGYDGHARTGALGAILFF
jgi:predicted porin